MPAMVYPHVGQDCNSFCFLQSYSYSYGVQHRLSNSPMRFKHACSFQALSIHRAKPHQSIHLQAPSIRNTQQSHLPYASDHPNGSATNISSPRCTRHAQPQARTTLVSGRRTLVQQKSPSVPANISPVMSPLPLDEWNQFHCDKKTKLGSSAKASTA
jgi:hypothetical protein